MFPVSILSYPPATSVAIDADATKHKKRESNRVSAYKSRKKHTERADLLHQEYEKLEKENSALHKEIQSLQQEHLNLTKVLQEHEAACLLYTPEIMLELLQQPDLWSQEERELAFIY
uniref:BZIP domain-containing protein n=1 Tax=Xenopus tropicalis TaxID=8364 RepID=A0A6I8QEW3_XENTR